MRNFLGFIVTILLVISVIVIGIFISSSLFYMIEMQSLKIPFFDVLKTSIKAGSAGGLVGGVGIYFIPYFSKK